MDTNKQILEKANSFVTQGEYELFLNYCTEDVQWTFVGERILRGKEAVRQYMRETYLEPPRFEVLNLIAENEYVTAIGNIALKNSDGKTIQYSYCDVWKFREGKLSELNAFVIETKNI